MDDKNISDSSVDEGEQTLGPLYVAGGNVNQ